MDLVQYKFEMETTGESFYEGDFDQNHSVEQTYEYIEPLRKALQNHLTKLYQKIQQDIQNSNDYLNKCVETYVKYKRA